MVVITAKIFNVEVVSEKKVYIILQKQQDGEKTLLAVDVYGKWKYKADALKLRKGDKIKARLFVKSKFVNGRWFNDLSFKTIEKVNPAYVKQPNEFDFDDDIIGEKHIYDENGNILL